MYYEFSFDDLLDLIGCYRLRIINESVYFMLSDDEYDKTEDDFYIIYFRNGRKIKRFFVFFMEEEFFKKRKSGDEVSKFLRFNLFLYIELRMN